MHAANWHPLTWLSHMLDVELFAMDPGPHHVVNLVFHVLNTLLLFGLLYSITGALGRSAFVAALFAVHPLHVESVVDFRAQGCSQHVSFGCKRHVGLRFLHPTAEIEQLSHCDAVSLLGPAGKADARDAAIRAVTAGFLAATTRSICRGGGGKDSGGCGVICCDWWRRRYLLSFLP